MMYVYSTIPNQFSTSFQRPLLPAKRVARSQLVNEPAEILKFFKLVAEEMLVFFLVSGTIVVMVINISLFLLVKSHFYCTIYNFIECNVRVTVMTSQYHSRSRDRVFRHSNPIVNLVVNLYAKKEKKRKRFFS